MDLTQIIVLAVLGSIGALTIWLGWRIQKKGKIALAKDLQWEHISPKDYAAYTAKMGLACAIIGLGVLVTGVLAAFWMDLWVFFVPIPFWVAGGVLMAVTQMHYTGGFSS